MNNIEKIRDMIISNLSDNYTFYNVYQSNEKDNEIEIGYDGEEYKLTIEKVNLEANK